jgi:hypothetical protein
MSNPIGRRRISLVTLFVSLIIVALRGKERKMYVSSFLPSPAAKKTPQNTKIPLSPFGEGAEEIRYEKKRTGPVRKNIPTTRRREREEEGRVRDKNPKRQNAPCFGWLGRLEVAPAQLSLLSDFRKIKH